MAQAHPLLQSLQRELARYPQLDPKAVLSVFQQEGLGGGIGDGGHAFGPAQLNDAGGVITGKFPGWSPQQIQAWAWSPKGLRFALEHIANVAAGLHGPQAVNAIVSRFERPANIPGEINRALTSYGAPAAGPENYTLPTAQGGSLAQPQVKPAAQNGQYVAGLLNALLGTTPRAQVAPTPIAPLPMLNAPAPALPAALPAARIPFAPPGTLGFLG